MREWEIGAVENIHGALPYIRFAPLLALVGVGVNRIGKELATLIPDAKLCIFEQGAHSCSQTISEEFNRVILEFLQSQEILSIS